MIYDVAIIGASIAGNRVASLLPEKYSTLLIEEHKYIGLPSHCTGLVSFRLLDLVPDIPKKIIVNEIKSAKFFSPNGNYLELKPKYPVYVINRVELDKFLFDQAKEKVEIKTGERFEMFRYMEDCIKIKTDKGFYRAKILIGADGPNSRVRREMEINSTKNFLIGLQSRVYGNFDSKSVELWFGSKICPNFFAWVVPENEEVARVGLATNKNPVKYYDHFMKLRMGIEKKYTHVGIIRYGIMKKTVADRVMLVGDSALQVKPFSGGGIIYGLKAAEICTSVCKASLENNIFDCNFLMKNYDKEWKKTLYLPITKGLALRKIFNILPDVALNFLFYSLGHMKSLLEKFDMDLL